VDSAAAVPSAAPSIKARPLQAALSLAPNGALALTKSALTKIQLLEQAAFERSDACDGCKSIRQIHQIVIANHFFPFSLILLAQGDITLEEKRAMRRL
jgi:hypothetical protein